MKQNIYNKKRMEKYKEFINTLDLLTFKKDEDLLQHNSFNQEHSSKRKQMRLTVNKISDEYDKKYITRPFSEIKEYKDPNLFEVEKYFTLRSCEEKAQEPIPIPPIKIEKRLEQINVEINNLSDLIHLTEKYPEDPAVEYNINISAIHKIKPSLVELNNMIGMNSIKENVVDQLLYFIQDFHKSSGVNGGEFMHTVIYGPPGTGKTEVAKIMGKIFSQLGILKKGVFKKVTRSDLIAGYLGQTAIKTKDVIKECVGGCLFIDEAYALGNNDKKDSFSKECIDTLCEALSDYKDDLMVIIAGYEKELNECFFSYNQGLESRFIWRFKTDEYKGEELYKIFLKKVGDCGWTFCEGSNAVEGKKWFEKNQDYFKYFGRDVEALLSKTKIMHSRRVFCKETEEKKKITMKDLEKGFEYYLKNEEIKKRKEIVAMKDTMYSMYV